MARAEFSDGTQRALEPSEASLRIDGHGVGQLCLQGLSDGTDIVVRYRAGMANDWNWVPESLRLSVIRVASHFFNNRDAPDDPGIPPSVRRMISPWRARRM